MPSVTTRLARLVCRLGSSGKTLPSPLALTADGALTEEDPVCHETDFSKS